MSLLAFATRRLLWTIPLVVLVMLATYALMRGAGGTPFRPPEGYVVVPGPYQRILEDYYRLEEPWPVEFAYYVGRVFTFEFGPSMIHQGLRADSIVEQHFPVTLQLVALAAAWAIPAGFLLGIWAALRRGSGRDFLATSAATVLLVVPVFFAAFVLAKYFVFDWRLFPSGWASWQARLLPAVALGLAPVGYIARLVRGAVVETLQEPYVQTARAKGLTKRRVIWAHVLRNSLTPFLSAAIPMLALLVTGAFFVEEAFRIPGASSFFVEAARTRDYSVLLNLTVVLAVVVLVANAIADIALAVVDPRVREQVRV